MIHAFESLMIIREGIHASDLQVAAVLFLALVWVPGPGQADPQVDFGIMEKCLQFCADRVTIPMPFLAHVIDCCPESEISNFEAVGLVQAVGEAEAVIPISIIFRMGNLVDGKCLDRSKRTAAGPIGNVAALVIVNLSTEDLADSWIKDLVKQPLALFHLHCAGILADHRVDRVIL